MKCEECEYRFKCFTLPNKDRPHRVKINWGINSNHACGNCKNAKFGVRVANGSTSASRVGFCKTKNLLIHKNSASCEVYIPNRLNKINTVYDELRDALKKKHTRTGLPKYCLID